MTASPDRAPPLYAPEAPLPRAPYIPGRGARPGGEPAVPHPPRPGAPSDAASLAASVGFRHGVDLFNRGFYWEAHEAWEELWLPIPREGLESALLQGLIQAAAALLKLRTGAAPSAATIWERGRARLVRVAESRPGRHHLGVPIDPLLAAVDAALEAEALPEPLPAIRLDARG